MGTGHLHFNMLLLNLGSLVGIGAHLIEFTFQYASIKPYSCLPLLCGSLDLHFNMLLLNP